MNFSIIIPTYNNLNLLMCALNSVLFQEEVSFEIIIVDDSKTSIISDHIKQLNDQRIRYYHNVPSLGAVQNWNNGLSLAMGENLILLHHDESFKDKIFYLKRVLEHLNLYSVIISNIEVYYINTGKIRKSLAPICIKRLFLQFSSLIFFRNLIGPCACIAFKREKLKTFDNNLQWLVDVEWYYRILRESSVVFLEDLYVSSSHGHVDQITNNINIRSLYLSDLKVLKKKYRENKVVIISLFFYEILSFFKRIIRATKTAL